MREFDACGIGFVADAHGRPSRSIITAALGGLANVKHRGAVAADARTSDGTGLLTTIPAAIFGEGTGVVSLFVRGADPRAAVEAAAAAEGLVVIDWRTPPTDESALGELAAGSRPGMVQALIRPTDAARAEIDTLVASGVESRLGDAGSEDLERRAYRLRRRIDATTDGTYVVSCSFRTIVYKGLVAADTLADFYLDLADPRFEAHLAVFHQRFSTNTLPSWERAQPFRLLCHNGEINTIGGNENRMRARARLGTAEVGLGPEDLFRPVLDEEGSDSGKLDEAAELLVRGGRHLGHAMAMLVPEAWEETRDLDPEVRGFYEYHSALMEPWDGPAGVIFTDGIRVGAVLDRNGLRPLRYALCEDGLVVCASEMGAVDVAGHGTVDRGRLGPGHMMIVSPKFGAVRNMAVKERLSAEAPYAQWAADGFVEVPPGDPVAEPPTDLLVRQAAHGFTREELAMVLKPMAADAYEPTFAMGDDSPLPPMAGRARPVAHYLRQRFAQVTNPPIDPLRERLVMSLRTLLGPRSPLLLEGPDAARLLTLESFFLYPSAIESLLGPAGSPYPVGAIDTSFAVDGRARRPPGRGRDHRGPGRGARRRRRRHPRARPRASRPGAGTRAVAARAGRRPPAPRRAAADAPTRASSSLSDDARDTHFGGRPPRVRGRRRVPAPRAADRRRGGRRRPRPAIWSAPTPRNASAPPSRPAC